MSREVPISEIMSEVSIEIEESDIVVCAICIALVAPMEGNDRARRLHLSSTPGIDWITLRGMLGAAMDVERGIGDLQPHEDDDDEE